LAVDGLQGRAILYTSGGAAGTTGAQRSMICWQEQRTQILKSWIIFWKSNARLDHRRAGQLLLKEC
jgi:hypothetical protein